MNDLKLKEKMLRIFKMCLKILIFIQWIIYVLYIWELEALAVCNITSPDTELQRETLALLVCEKELEYTHYSCIGVSVSDPRVEIDAECYSENNQTLIVMCLGRVCNVTHHCSTVINMVEKKSISVMKIDGDYRLNIRHVDEEVVESSRLGAITCKDTRTADMKTGASQIDCAEQLFASFPNCVTIPAASEATNSTDYNLMQCYSGKGNTKRSICSKEMRCDPVSNQDRQGEITLQCKDGTNGDVACLLDSNEKRDKYMDQCFYCQNRCENEKNKETAAKNSDKVVLVVVGIVFITVTFIALVYIRKTYKPLVSDDSENVIDNWQYNKFKNMEKKEAKKNNSDYNRQLYRSKSLSHLELLKKQQSCAGRTSVSKHERLCELRQTKSVR